MSEENDKLVSDHAYDGIQEFDNPLPMWWLCTFFITVIFGFIYWIHYEFAGGQGIWSELKADMAQIEALRAKSGGGQDKDEEINALIASGAAEQKGKVVYDGKCAACHGPQLQGLIGPNLVDDHWINGKGKPSEIASVIRKGVLDKGMPAWNDLLSGEEIKSVSAWVAKNRGSQPPNPKPPQGEKVVEL